MRRLYLKLFLMGLLATGGCVHKISIQQGNYLDDKAVERVETGMTRDQVKILLGTPMADGPFNNDRWDYVYFYSNGRTGQVIRKVVTLYFDGNAVSRIERQDG